MLRRMSGFTVTSVRLLNLKVTGRVGITSRPCSTTSRAISLPSGWSPNRDGRVSVSRGIPGVKSRSASDQRGTRAGVKSLQ